MTDWDTFFDDLYLTTYVPRLHHADAEGDALAAVALAGCPDEGEVLDCPCGFGRHSLPLARAGYRVVAVDRSPAQLDEARRRAQGVGATPQWVEADYRELPLERGRFDCVLNLFSSLGYHGEEGDRRALAEFHRVLRPGGALVVETLHRDRLARIFAERGWDPLPDGGLLVEERRFDLVAGTTHVEHTFVPADGARRSFSYDLRIYTVTELDRLLRGAGFTEVEHFGGLRGEPLSWDTRLVAVARAG